MIFSSCFIKVEWSNNQVSWVKECDLPPRLKGKHCRNVVKAVEFMQFGNTVRMLIPDESGEAEQESMIVK
jgi:hypothetical protein